MIAEDGRWKVLKGLIYKGWFGQDYGIDKYAYSAIGLAGAAILKIGSVESGTIKFLSYVCVNAV